MSNLIDGNSRFSLIPSTNFSRSKLPMGHTVKTSFNVGDLIPFDVLEVLPGDTWEIDTSFLGRLQTLLTPIMDDIYLDMYYFFVPNRLTWSHWKEFNGENTQSSWYPTVQYTVPLLSTYFGSENPHQPLVGTVLDYFGIPFQNYNKGTHCEVNALPFRAYGLIYNEWFRDQNTQSPVLVSTGDFTSSFDFNNGALGGYPFKVNKYHDYFTSCLPSPQKGPDVTIPITKETMLPVGTGFMHSKSYSDGLMFQTVGGSLTSGYHSMALNTYEQGNYSDLLASTASGSGGNALQLAPANLWASIGGENAVPVASVNQLRLAFATQKLYEVDARSGSRYTEILKAHFGVDSPDSRLQRPELLSYNHVDLNISQVIQNGTQTSGTTPLGHVAAMSVTGNSDSSFTKSFVEHGFIIGLCCLRYKHSYQQGLHKMWSRKTRFDYYWPVFAHIGEQPVLNKEIYASGSSTDDEVFGYQEAWAEYRYIPNRTSAFMRSGVNQSLDIWHLGDKYVSMPFLSSDWIKEDGSIIDRTLAVSSNLSHQFYCDIYVNSNVVRVMPTYSVPGLIDHM
ncbi:major capsid protein [Capybara microvirus Cap3_SP_465]|nr:major capsid protein [Capybara microvirus Cap3_SP_465]